MSAGIDGRQVALDVDDDVVPALGIEALERLEDAVGAGRVVGAGHARRSPPARSHRLDDLGLVGRDHDRAEPGLHGAAPDMDDHRLAVDVGQRLARQPGRGHAGGDENDGVGHRWT